MEQGPALDHVPVYPDPEDIDVFLIKAVARFAWAVLALIAVAGLCLVVWWGW